MDKALRDLIDVIQFTENVAARIHGVNDETEIFRIVTEEFVQSERSMTGILMLEDDESWLSVAQVSLSRDVVKRLEEAAASPIEEYRIELSPSNILSRVVKQGKTIVVTSDVLFEAILPASLTSPARDIMGLGEENSILTPLYRGGRIVGVLMIMAPEMAEYFIPSVRNLARHISTALELADEQDERRRAETLLQKHREHLEKLVRERTSSLEEANTALRVMLKTADQVKSEMRENVLFNVKRFVLPYLEEIKRSPMDERQMLYLKMLEQSLNEVTSPFLQGMSAQSLSLTPTEITVTSLIKQGKTTKEIADMLHMSPRTVETHRYNIRTKLGLKNTTVNLRTYISSLDNLVEQVSIS